MVRAWSIRAYIVGTWCLAFGVLLAGWENETAQLEWTWWGAAALFTAMLVAETQPVRIPGGSLRSVATIPHIAAALLLPPWLAAVTAGAGMLLAELRGRARLDRLVFNPSNTIVIVGGSGLLAARLGIDGGHLRDPDADHVLAFFAVVLAYYLINDALLSGIVSLASTRNPVRFFLDGARHSAAAEVSAATIGGLAAFVWVNNPYWSPLIVVPSLVSQLTFSYLASSAHKGAQLASLDTLGRSVAATLAPRETFDVVWEQLRGQFNIEGSFLHIPGQSIDYVVGGADRPEAEPVRRRLEGEVKMRRSACQIREARGWSGPLGGDMWLAVPVLMDGEEQGCLGVVASARRFAEEDEHYLGLVAEWVSLALEHARLVKDAAEADALRALDRMRDELVSVVSHELRTPLATLVGFSELLLTRQVSATQRRQYLDIIHQEGQRLADLSEQILDVQRLQGGQSQPEPVPVAVGPIVQRAVAVVGVDKLRPVSVSGPPDVPAVLADANRIQQVVVNLLNNARKYSPEGGKIRVCIEPLEQEVRVSVEDNGLGLPPEALPRLFEKFYRVNSPSHRGIKGTGLGLAICRAIVESHGGRIWAESEGPGLGTRFSFTLPRVDTQAPGPEGAGREQ